MKKLLLLGVVLLAGYAGVWGQNWLSPAKYYDDLAGIHSGRGTYHAIFSDSSGGSARVWGWSLTRMLDSLSSKLPLHGIADASYHTDTTGWSPMNSYLTTKSDSSLSYGNWFILRRKGDTTVIKVDQREAYTGTGIGYYGAPRLFLGTNTPNGDDAGIAIGRKLVGQNLFSHGFRDETTFHDSLGTDAAYCAFDAIPTITGGFAGHTPYNHLNDFQARPIINVTDSVNAVYGATFRPTLNGGVVPQMYGFYAQNPIKNAGTIRKYYGFYMEPLTTPASSYGVYIAGTSPNYFAGKLTTDDTIWAHGGKFTQGIHTDDTLWASGGKILGLTVGQNIANYSALDIYGNLRVQQAGQIGFSFSSSSLYRRLMDDGTNLYIDNSGGNITLGHWTGATTEHSLVRILTDTTKANYGSLIVQRGTDNDSTVITEHRVYGDTFDYHVATTHSPDVLVIDTTTCADTLRKVYAKGNPALKAFMKANGRWYDAAGLQAFYGTPGGSTTNADSLNHVIGTSYVLTSDSRLSDARTPLAHNQAISTITNLQDSLNVKAKATHTHAESDITNLTTDLAGKLAAGGTATNSAQFQTLDTTTLKAHALLGTASNASQLQTKDTTALKAVFLAVGAKATSSKNSDSLGGRASATIQDTSTETTHWGKVGSTLKNTRIYVKDSTQVFTTISGDTLKIGSRFLFVGSATISAVRKAVYCAGLKTTDYCWANPGDSTSIASGAVVGCTWKADSLILRSNKTSGTINYFATRP